MVLRQSILFVVLLFAACGNNTETYPDFNIKTVKDFSSYYLETDALIQEVPDLGEHICSPAGYYTFHVEITQNNCPVSIVKKNKWTNSLFMKSYHCITYFIDGYNFLDNGMILYCIYYTEPKLNGILQWAECTVFLPDSSIFCEFKFSAPLTTPNNN